MKLATYKGTEDLMKHLLITPLFKSFKNSVFFSSLNQNSCPVNDTEEIQNKNKKSY